MVEELAAAAGLQVVEAFTCTTTYDYADEEQFLRAMLVRGRRRAGRRPAARAALRAALVEEMAGCRRRRRRLRGRQRVGARDRPPGLSDQAATAAAAPSRRSSRWPSFPGACRLTGGGARAAERHGRPGRDRPLPRPREPARCARCSRSSPARPAARAPSPRSRTRWGWPRRLDRLRARRRRPDAAAPVRRPPPVPLPRRPRLGSSGRWELWMDARQARAVADAVADACDGTAVGRS